MRFFRHTTAEYACAKQCGYHRSVAGANWSAFHLIVAVAATVPLGWFFLHKQFPWYCLVGILSGELLLVYAAGFLSGLVFLPFGGTSRCKQCGAPMMFCGRHFDPAGSRTPHRSDIAILVIFIMLNIAVWVAVLRSYG